MSMLTMVTCQMIGGPYDGLEMDCPAGVRQVQLPWLHIQASGGMYPMAQTIKAVWYKRINDRRFGYVDPNAPIVTE